MSTIFVILPHVDTEWVEAKEGEYYVEAWNEFNATPKDNYGERFAEKFAELSDYQHQMWEPHYCTDVFRAIPNCVRHNMEEQGVFDCHVTDENVEAFNQASRDAITSIADVIADTYHTMMGIERGE